PEMKRVQKGFHLWNIHGIGYFPNSVELALGPLFYLYLRSLVQNQRPAKAWLHFLPFFISQAYSVVVYVTVLQTHDVVEKRSISDALYFDEVKNLDEYGMLLGMVIYLYLAYQWVTKAKPTSEFRAAELRFVKYLMPAFLFMGLYSLVNLILNYWVGYQYEWRWQIGHVLVAAMVYYLGIVGYKNSEVHKGGFGFSPSKPPTEPLDDRIADTLAEAVEKDKVYLNPKLTLRALADILGVSEADLTRTIQAQYGKNFRSFLNEVRVREVQTRLRTEGLGNLSLAGLARECGFNSEASFYRVFKEHTGMTPKQYLEQH
ncbi:MAG: helix-turn-helix transcriptional regulator, partial [Bacteroidota bacterium]